MDEKKMKNTVKMNIFADVKKKSFFTCLSW